MILEYEDGRLMAKWLDVETGLEQLFILPEASLLPIAQLPGGDWICERYSSARGHDLVRIEPVTMRVTNLDPHRRTVSGRIPPGAGFPLDLAGWLADPGLALSPAGRSRAA